MTASAFASTFGLSRPALLREPVRLSGIGECLVLAALLHLLAVALLGSAPGGSARPGEGVWGSLNIRLAGTGEPRAEVAAPPPPPEAYTGPAGQAAERRWGGVVREMAPRAPQPVDEAGAPRLGTWHPTPTASDVDPRPETPAPLPVQDSTAPPAAAVVAPVPAPAPTPEPTPIPTPAVEPTPPVFRELRAPAVPRELRAAPALPSGPGQIAPLPALAPAAEMAPLPPRPLPPPSMPAPAPAPAPVETRTLSTPPQALPVPPSPPLTRVAPVEPVNLSAPNAPAMVSPTPAPPSTPTPAAMPTPATSAVPGRAPDATAPPRPAFGNPDAGASLGHDVATPPSAPASAPRLNLDLARPRGGEISRQGSRGVLNFLPHPPERDSKLGEDIQKSARPDCRTAYSSMGILAAAPLAADAIKKDGCRW